MRHLFSWEIKLTNPREICAKCLTWSNSDSRSMKEWRTIAGHSEQWLWKYIDRQSPMKDFSGRLMRIDDTEGEEYANIRNLEERYICSKRREKGNSSTTRKFDGRTDLKRGRFKRLRMACRKERVEGSYIISLCTQNYCCLLHKLLRMVHYTLTEDRQRLVNVNPQTHAQILSYWRKSEVRGKNIINQRYSKTLWTVSVNVPFVS